MRRLSLATGLLLTLTALGGLAACRNVETYNGTALFVSVSWSNLSPDQLRFSVVNTGGNLFSPVVRPTTAATKPLSSPQTVHILLPDRAAGSATVHVEALAKGKTIGLADGPTAVRQGHEVSVGVVLVAGESCTCANGVGCCQATTCVTSPSPMACGQGGGLCAVCNNQSDTCSADGHCVCGTTGAPCAQGQECVQGVCSCTPVSCPDGCCRIPGPGGICDVSHTDVACGVAGRTCQTCSIGACVGGVCNSVCGSALTPCTTGCCSGNDCVHAESVYACGTGAKACQVCDTTRANLCGAAGTCKCGTNPECVFPQKCVTAGGVTACQ